MDHLIPLLWAALGAYLLVQFMGCITDLTLFRLKETRDERRALRCKAQIRADGARILKESADRRAKLQEANTRTFMPVRSEVYPTREEEETKAYGSTLPGVPPPPNSRMPPPAPGKVKSTWSR